MAPNDLADHLVPRREPLQLDERSSAGSEADILLFAINGKAEDIRLSKPELGEYRCPTA
jgi:hypothetical protein